MSSLTEERKTYKPFKYGWAFDAWDIHEKSHWVFQEVPMNEDLVDWQNKLTKEEKEFLTNIFRFFTQADIDVAGGYVDNYLPFFKQPEIRMMLLSFASREATHIAAYSHLIESLGMPESTYEDFLKYKEMVNKHSYLTKFSSKTKEGLAKSMAVFSGFTEGLQLFSSFIMLLNFVRNGKMRGMGQIISWSVADETIHFESMIKLFKTYIKENREIWTDKLKSSIYSICEKMVELEDAFIDLCFKSGGIIGLTADEVKKYIRYIADRRLISMGMKGIYKVKKNPLPWVAELLNAPTHTNFFENKATDYVKGGLTGNWGEVWA